MFKLRNLLLLHTAGLALASAGAARAAEVAAVELASTTATEGGETIIVTGTRGARARTVADSPVPIDVITPQELQATGRTGLKEILGNIIPSLTMPALGGGGTSASVRPISIRGLSGDYLLVLVNGKRRHTTALINNLSRISGGSTPVDIDLIPTNAVGRLELLRDGAAAQYGSDAISGVLNIILDSAPEGGEFTTTAGQLYEKGGELLQQTLSYGTRIGDGGFIRFAVEGKYHDRADSSASPINRIYVATDGTLTGPPDPREANAEHLIAGGYGRSNRDIIVNGSYNAELPLGDAATLYSFSTLSYRNIKDARGAITPASPTNGFTALPEIFPNGFQAYRRIRETDYQATLGARGDLGSWDWDLSSSFGRDDVWLGAENTLNPSLGPIGKTDFFMGKQIQDLWVNNLDVSRGFEIGLAQPLTVALGIEHRWERFQNKAGEPDSYRDGGYVIPTGSDPFHRLWGGRSPSPGLVSFTGTSPADATSLSRNNIAAYVDVSANLTPRWFVGVAGRAEHYDDSAGETISGKFSTRYEIAPGLAVRGGVNTGFRAPSLAQTGFSTTQNTVTVIGDERVSTTSKFLPVNSAAAIALGARPLKPEKSLNFTGGVTYESDAFRLTVDGYRIDVDDRIVKTEFLGTANNGGAAIATILQANGVDDVDSAQFFTNAIDTRTWGVDAVAEYTLRTSGAGVFRFNAAYSYNKTKIRQVIDNPSELQNLNVVLFGRQARQDFLVATPRSKVVIGGNWAIGLITATARATHYGNYIEASNVESGDRKFGAQWVADLDISYALSERFTLSVGANNLFDAYPDRNGIVAVDGSGQYGNFAPFGLSGGFYYGRVRVRL
jgi:iron complex outermembrane receptor protein